MVSDKQESDANKASTEQAEVLQGQLHNMLSGVERSLAVTCENIMEKMKQLEDKMDDMEKRYHELAKDAEEVLKEPTKEPTKEPASDA